MTNYVKAPADVLNVNCTICCPNGHILGAFEEGDTLRVKHKGVICYSTYRTNPFKYSPSG